MAARLEICSDDKDESGCLSVQLGINLLLDDGAPNPYTMLLIGSSENPVVASLNIKDASNDVYRLVDQSLIVPCR